MLLIGAALLTKLKPAQISAAYAQALRSGRRDGKGGLAPRTVHHMHRILKQALSVAVEWDLLVKNPAASVSPPKAERKAMGVLDEQQTVALLNHFRPTRMFVPVMLGCLCGLRCDEITALPWRAVDLERGQLLVAESSEQTRSGLRRKETENGHARTVALPLLVVEDLRRHRVRSAEELLRLGAKIGPTSPVVMQEDGTALQLNSLTHEFVRLLAKASDLQKIRFYDLRHTHATNLLDNSVHPKVAQERLGHSTVSVTLDVYSHVTGNLQKEDHCCHQGIYPNTYPTSR